ncbi:MAG: hypothetical protein KDB26_05390, partial [Microthrixaceae bacterium]|nr:hypothetical protein [Microthrixaceae bacterium]
ARVMRASTGTSRVGYGSNLPRPGQSGVQTAMTDSVDEGHQSGEPMHGQMLSDLFVLNVVPDWSTNRIALVVKSPTRATSPIPSVGILVAPRRQISTVLV